MNKEELLSRLKHPNEDIRHQALQVMGTIDEAWVVSPVISCLGDSDWRIRKAAAEILVKHTDPVIINEIIECLRDQENAGRRNAALEALVQMGESIIEQLRPHQKDTDADFRKFVVDVLGNIASNSAVPVLLEFLNDEDDNVCAAAVEFLGKMKDQRAIAKLVALLGRNKFWLSYAVIAALGEIGNPKVIENVTPLLADERYVPSVLSALGNIPSLKAAKCIIPYLTHPKRSIRTLAIQSLVHINDALQEAFYLSAEDKRGVASLIPREKLAELEPFLITLLDDSDYAVRRSAVVVLGWLKSRNASPKLIEGLMDPALQRDCRNALLGIGTDIVPLLVDEIEHSDERVRISVAWILGELKDHRAEKSLIKRLTDDIGHVRSAAAVALQKLKSMKAVPELIKLLSDEYTDVRDAAVNALVDIDGENLDQELHHLVDSKSLPQESAIRVYCAVADETMIDTMLFLLKNENHVIRKNVVRRLATFSQDKVLEPLLFSLTDENPEVRIIAADAVSKMDKHYDAVFEALSRAVYDKNIWVAVAVINALGAMEHPKIETLLMNRLMDPIPMIRIAVIKALSRYGSPQVIERLSNLVRDSTQDLEVRRNAVTTLGKIADESTLSLLQSLLDDPDWNLRLSVVTALGNFECAECSHIIARLAMDEGEHMLIRLQAIEQLGSYPSPEVVQNLISLLASNEERVVKAAFFSLRHIRKTHPEYHIPDSSHENYYYTWLLDYI